MLQIHEILQVPAASAMGMSEEHEHEHEYCKWLPMDTPLVPSGVEGRVE